VGNSILYRKASLLVMLVAASATVAQPAPSSNPPRAIDTHTHFYDPSRPQGVPWPGKGDKLLYRTVLPTELKELSKKHHVRGTIAVEASPWLEDNQWLLDLAAREPFIVGVIGRLDPASDDFPKHLERFARDPLFRGIRINHDELKRGLGNAKFVDHLRLMVDRDLTLDVNGGPDMPADVATLAGKIPALRIVINHAANLTIDGKAVPASWLKGMRDAAAHKKVFCKVSALVEGTRKRNGDTPAAVDFYRSVLDALWQTFGEDRLMYGSNWPVSDHAAPYATVYEIPRKYFEERGANATEKFFQRNAAAAYKIVIRDPNRN
jgi:L-fuconolactonase